MNYHADPQARAHPQLEAMIARELPSSTEKEIIYNSGRTVYRAIEAFLKITENHLAPNWQIDRYISLHSGDGAAALIATITKHLQQKLDSANQIPPVDDASFFARDYIQQTFPSHIDPLNAVAAAMKTAPPKGRGR